MVASNYGGEYCQYLPGEAIDTFVSQWVLKALEPAALTLSLEATARLEQERQELGHLWQQRLERAAYESERAARHYRLVEPLCGLHSNVASCHHLPLTPRAEDGQTPHYRCH